MLHLDPTSRTPALPGSLSRPSPLSMLTVFLPLGLLLPYVLLGCGPQLTRVQPGMGDWGAVGDRHRPPSHLRCLQPFGIYQRKGDIPSSADVTCSSREEARSRPTASAAAAAQPHGDTCWGAMTPLRSVSAHPRILSPARSLEFSPRAAQAHPQPWERAIVFSDLPPLPPSCCVSRNNLVI